MTKIYLKKFALTGEFGPVKIGMSKDQVIQLMGEPETDQDFGSGSSGLLYSWYEFFYETETGVLNSIQNDHLQDDCSNHDESITFKNDKIEIDTWFLRLNQDLTRSDVKKALMSQGIPFSEEEYWGSDIIRFESGVYLDFDDRDGVWGIDEDGTVEKDESVVVQNKENFVLNGIRYFPEMNE
tara:strand:+ start:21 stop:566 length:546 start_codon:yes stop_codon:yes gene_type:complete